METPKQDTQLCRSCRESIAVSALRCRHCGEFQNWKSYLGLGNSVLALLIALISVFTLAVKVVVDVSSEEQSRLISVLQVANTEGIVVYAENIGERPLVITRADLYLIIVSLKTLFDANICTLCDVKA